MQLKSIINKVLPLLFAAFLLSCTKEMEQPVKYRIIHYKAQAGNEALTRATVDGGNHYVFENTDQLYLASAANPDQLYGVLYLTAGAGTGNAWFEGDLYCQEGFELSDATQVKVTLINSQDRIHTCQSGHVTATEYPTDDFAPDFATAVKYFSDFTGTSTFGSHDFSLSQNSAFLIFNIRMSIHDIEENASVSAQLSSSGQSIWSASVQAQEAGKLRFVTAFKGGDVTLFSARLSLSWDQSNKEIDDIANTSLAANNYYTISRSTLSYNGFRIIALQDGTTVHFNHTGDGLKYSTDTGDTWTSYDAESDIILNAGDELCFKGNKANYKNAKADQYGSPDTRPIFTSNKTVKIAGHIMSLIAGDNYSDTTPMPEDAFNGAFSKGSDADNTDITIDAEDPLIFPSTINVRCYKNMFRGCKNLVTVPDLPATTIASECYYSMFRRCPNLISVKCNLQGTVTRAEIENAVDKWFVKSGSTTMLNTNGTFYCPAAMKDVWDELHVANHSLGGIPTTWQIVTY